MKRFHMHLSVDDLAANINFYSRLFGFAPTVQKDDYAKWMLDDPRINFAISSRGTPAGLDHIGIQVESEAELEQVKTMYLAADQAAVIQQEAATCCYAQSNKYWLTDPQGVAWEAFHTLADIPTFGAQVKPEASAVEGNPQVAATACCAPGSSKINLRGKPLSIPVKGSSCC